MRIRALAIVSMVCVSAPLVAETIAFELANVWLDPSDSWTESQPMYGTVVWEYEPGDFENGTGVLMQLDIPWWSEQYDPPLSANVEPEQIEITMDGNYHDYGVDIQLKFVSAFTELGGAGIDTTVSAFEIQRGTVYQGMVVSGELVPVTCMGDFDGSGEVDVTDVLGLIAAWETPDADVTGDGVTDVDDLLVLLGAWGGCVGP